jgi:hypothetical protein
MSIKYNKNSERYDVYQDRLSNEEVVELVNDIDNINKEKKKFERKLVKAKLELSRLQAEIENCKNKQILAGSVTDIIDGVPISEYMNKPTMENSNGTYSFSAIKTGDKGKYLEAWTDANLSDDGKVNGKYKWVFSLKDGYRNQEIFMARQYSCMVGKNGFSTSFLRMIAKEYVVNDRPVSDFHRNLDQWIKIEERNNKLENLLS